MDDKQRIKKQFQTAGIVIFTAVVIILFYFCVKRYDGLGAGLDKLWSVLRPFVIGFIMAFLMNPIMKFFEGKLYPFIKKHSKNEENAAKTSRIISTLIALVIFIALIVLFFVSVVPELYNTITYLFDNLTKQIQSVLVWANDITNGKYEKTLLHIKDEQIEDALDTAYDWISNKFIGEEDDMVENIISGAVSIGTLAVHILIGIFVSVYMLIDKEKFKGQIKKLIYGIFRADKANVIVEVIRKSSDIFYGFIIGKIIDSAIIGVICYVVMIILSMPYAALCSIIVGVTNIIPVFGPYIGAVPTVIIIFLTNPVQGIYFLIFVIILQQLDGNLIGPKILGDSTGISSFWVVVSIVVGGGLFGFAGMLLGVPTMAVIYYIVGRFSRWMLKKRSLPGDTGDYILLNEVNVETNEMNLRTKEEDDIKRLEIFKNSPFKEKRKEKKAKKSK